MGNKSSTRKKKNTQNKRDESTNNKIDFNAKYSQYDSALLKESFESLILRGEMSYQYTHGILDDSTALNYYELLKYEVESPHVYIFGLHKSGKSCLEHHLTFTSNDPKELKNQTLDKYIKNIYNRPNEWSNSSHQIREQCIKEILVLYKICDKLYEKDPIKWNKFDVRNVDQKRLQILIKYTKFDLNIEDNPIIICGVKQPSKYTHEQIQQILNDFPKISQSIQYIWDMPQIKDLYFNYYGELFVITPNSDYWFDNIDKIMTPKPKFHWWLDEFVIRYEDATNGSYASTSTSTIPILNKKGEKVWKLCRFHDKTHGYTFYETTVFDWFRKELLESSIDPCLYQGIFCVNLCGTMNYYMDRFCKPLYSTKRNTDINIDDMIYFEPKKKKKK
eukprot:363847_1